MGYRGRNLSVQDERQAEASRFVAALVLPVIANANDRMLSDELAGMGAQFDIANGGTGIGLGDTWVAKLEPVSSMQSKTRSTSKQEQDRRNSEQGCQARGKECA